MVENSQIQGSTSGNMEFRKNIFVALNKRWIVFDTDNRYQSKLNIS